MNYITGSLEAGLVCPSSSPAGAGFFFVGKKDGSLCSCIDYSPQNDITIKNRYHFAALEGIPEPQASLHHGLWKSGDTSWRGPNSHSLPGSRNIKPDVLSRLFDPKTKQTETILPLNCVVGAVTWPIENEVIHWAYTSLLSCHPGVKRAMFVISQRSWWPTMEPEVWEYIEACPVCAQNKTSSKARTGLLQPLPIPSRPWSDISIDFVKGSWSHKETPRSSLVDQRVCGVFC
ncbi:uncharacterized protein AB9X84_024154 isoform 1-T2 [Acanthopagrus schlegelii]